MIDKIISFMEKHKEDITSIKLVVDSVTITIDLTDPDTEINN